MPNANDKRKADGLLKAISAHLTLSEREVGIDDAYDELTVEGYANTLLLQSSRLIKKLIQ